MDAFGRGAGPARAIHLEREVHFHDGEGGTSTTSPIRVTISYLDGLSRPVQLKMKADPGDAIRRDGGGAVLVDGAGRPTLAHAAERWLANGHEVRNNKAWLVRTYEPWFSDTAEFESDLALRRYGTSTRNTSMRSEGCCARISPTALTPPTPIRPGRYAGSDANDNVTGSAYEAARLALAPAIRSAMPEQGQAHARTPVIVDHDPLGREIAVRELGDGGVERRTSIELGVLGLPVRRIDARGLTAFSHRYDCLSGRSSKRAWTRAIAGACSMPMAAASGAGTPKERATPTASMRTVVTSQPGHGTRRVRQADRAAHLWRQPAVSQAALRNLRGRLVEHRDEAGALRIERCHMDGQALAKRRMLRDGADAHKNVVDWSTPALVPLQAVQHQSVQRLDGLGRPARQTLPDGTTREYSYATLGHLAEVRLSTADNALNRQVIATGIEANARGQHVRIAFGNAVETVYEYDRETFRLTRLLTRATGSAGRLYQDIAYAYDPVGNITRYVDTVQDPGASVPLVQGLTVSPACDFAYDAFYRLTRASGRVHQALLQHDYRDALPDAEAIKGTRHISLNNGAAIERYTRHYEYDLAGNFMRMRHVGASHSWSTNYWTSPNSNRSLPRDDLNGNALVNPESHFDANGNTIRLPHLSAMDWDHNDRLTRAVVIDRSGAGLPDDAEYYVYGGDGLRIRRVTERLVAGDVETTETLFLDGCEIKRIVRNNVTRLERLTSYISDGARRLATLHQWSVDDAGRETDDLAAKKLHYQVGNHLGSVSLELDPAGAIISYEEYFPFGGTSFLAGRSIRDVKLKDIRYSGKCRDDMTGLYCYEFRYYAPFIGNWLSPDPLGPASGLNLYCFVSKHPINFIDLLGLDAVKLAGGPKG